MAIKKYLSLNNLTEYDSLIKSIIDENDEKKIDKENPTGTGLLSIDGNGWFSGDVYVGGTSKDEGVKLATINDILNGGNIFDENTELITTDDIDAICGSTFQYAEGVDF